MSISGTVQSVPSTLFHNRIHNVNKYSALGGQATLLAQETGEKQRRTKRKAEKAKQRKNKRERKRSKSLTFPDVSAFLDIKTFLNQHLAKVRTTRIYKNWCNASPVDFKAFI
jgi:hypothetical protein